MSRAKAPGARWPRPRPIAIEQEGDGRRPAEIAELPGVLTYGSTPAEAIARVQALADRVERRESAAAGVAGPLAVA